MKTKQFESKDITQVESPGKNDLLFVFKHKLVNRSTITSLYGFEIERQTFE